jgi:hypothetical protein
LFVSGTEKQARAGAILGELAELGLMLARELAGQARACEDAEQQVALVDAFHKTSRAVRLTLALDARLDRDAARAARDTARDMRDAEAEARRAPLQATYPPPPPTPVEARKTRVRNLANRLLWNESEGDEEAYEILVEEFDARLDEAARAPDFEVLPVEAIAQSIAADIGLRGDIVLTLCEPAPTGSAPIPARPPTPVSADTG